MVRFHHLVYYIEGNMDETPDWIFVENLREENEKLRSLLKEAMDTLDWENLPCSSALLTKEYADLKKEFNYE